VAPMKTILVPVEQHSTLPSVLETALLVGRSVEGYIEGFAVGPDLRNIIALEVVFAPPMLDETAQREMVETARQRFETFMHAHAVPEARQEPNGLSFGWLGDTLKDDPFIGDYGRAFDIIIIGRPGSSSDGPRTASLEEALFESGRPVLVAPPRPPIEIGRSIVIAWNGSTETARAIAFAMPLLLRAERVTVLTVTGGTVPGPAGDQIARSLRFNGVLAQAVHVEPEGRSTGEAILVHAERLGADLLVKGAYTQSRLRQMIFGGATRYLLDHVTLPMLMAH
jgi:nucleotide-binding universal stress UspA family protein